MFQQTRAHHSVLWITATLVVSFACAPAFATGTGKDLTGAWSGDDGATYYIMRDGRDGVWWIGMSADGGRSFTNVFHGQWHVNDSVGDPGNYGVITGEWADVPRGHSTGHGVLRIAYKFSGELSRINGSGFACSTWKKMDLANAPSSVDIFQNSLSDESGLTGNWSAPTGTYYLRQVGSRVWWLGIENAGNGSQGVVFVGTLFGRKLSGELGFTPWPGHFGGGTNTVTLQLDAPAPNSSFRALDGYYDPGTTWRRVNIVVATPPN